MGLIETEARRPRATADVQTFAGEEDRKRLTPTALKAFKAVAERWALSTIEAAALLGLSSSTWERIKAGRWDQTLSQDQLTRTSALVGIYKGLHLLFADGMADQWPRLHNKGPVFRSVSPVEAMIEGGIPRMLETRQHVDALRGGL